MSLEDSGFENEPTTENNHPYPLSPERVSEILVFISLASIIAFITIFLAENLPVKLFFSIWQINAAVTLVDNAFLVLIGIALINLAAWLSPDNLALQRFRKRLSRLAVWAAAGFLLLPPLIIHATWRSRTILLDPKIRQIESTRNRLDSLRQLIANANTTQQIQDLLQKSQGLSLPPEDRARPVQVVRESLLFKLDTARRQLPDTRLQSSAWLWSALMRNSRVGILSLWYAVVFAVIAERRHRSSSLLSDGMSRFHATTINISQAGANRRAISEQKAAFRDEIRRTKELQLQRQRQDELDRQIAEQSLHNSDLEDHPAGEATQSQAGNQPARPAVQRGIPDLHYFDLISQDHDQDSGASGQPGDS